MSAEPPAEINGGRNSSLRVKALRLSLFGSIAFVLLLGAMILSQWSIYKPQIIALGLRKASEEKVVSRASQNSSPRILFICNDHISRSMIPYIVAGIYREECGLSPQIVQISYPQWTLQRHFLEGSYKEEMEKGGWDAVIIQEQVGRSLLEPEKFQQYFGLIIEQIRSTPDSTKKIFLYEPCSSRGFAGEQKRIRENCALAGLKSNCLVIHSGSSLERAAGNKSIEANGFLYLAGQPSPGAAGSYLIATMIYCAITKNHISSPLTSLDYTTFAGAVPLVRLSIDDARALSDMAGREAQIDKLK